MPSDLVVPVVSIEAVAPHPDADRLDVATVLGWRVVVAKDSMKAGDTCVYFPPDVCLPSREFSDKLGVTSYLRNGEALRVGCQRLRGVPSFGFLASLEACGLAADTPVGANVAEALGVTKWNPPIRYSKGMALHNIPNFPAYTSIPNYRHYPHELVEGEPVFITEKIHGTNCRVGLVDGVWQAGSHRRRLKAMEEGAAEDSMYWFPLSLPPVKRLLEKAARQYAGAVVLFGEVFGGSVMGDTFAYGVKKNTGLGFAAFDLWTEEKGYIDPEDFFALCDSYEVKTVPCLYAGPWSKDRLSLASGDSTVVGATNMREGIVIRPSEEKRIGERRILKYVSDEYLLRHAKGKIPDFTEA